MSWLEFPLRRYQFTIVAFLLLVAIGLTAWRQIPRSEDPYFPIPGFIIAVIHPGAGPQDMEQLVAKPIEDRLNELDDLKQLESTLNDGLAVVAVEFEAHVAADKKYDEVVRELNALRPELPSDLARIEIRKLNPGLVNIIQVALVSADAPYRELEDQARELKDRLKRVPGVRQSESWAFPERELRIALDLKRMTALGVTPGEVIAALASENANIPAGVVDVGSRSFSLRTSGNYSDLDEVRRTVISARDGRAVQIQDVATIEWAAQEEAYVGRFDGERAVFVTANQKDGQNIFATRDQIYALLDEFAQELPARIRLERGFDQSVNVAERLDRLTTDFTIAIALVSLTLLPLGLRAAGIVMISIPLSLAIGLACLYFTGFSLNQISIAGFVVALGLLVDDSVVVVENIARHLREGRHRYEAALAGTRQIFVAILGCTACLALAFLPLLVLPGAPGQFIRVLPASVLYTVGASLVVALTIIPFLASRILKREKDPHGNWFLRKTMAGIQRVYHPLLHRALARPRATVLGGLALVGASLAIVPVVGFSLFPKADTPQFLLTIETPDGSSLDETGRALEFVEASLRKRPEVRHYFSNLGHGNPMIYYNIIPRNEERNYAEVFVQLDGYSPRRTPPMLEALRRELDEYPNARIMVREFENGPPIDAPIVVRVLGPELDGLENLAGEVEKLIESVPGARDVENPLRVARTDLKLRVDSEKAALLGVPAVELDRVVRLAVAGAVAGQYRETNGEEYDIIVRTPIGSRATLDALDDVQAPSLNGGQIPLSQLATLEFSHSPTQVQRYDRERAVEITAQTENGYNTDKVTQALIAKLDAFDWPRGYHYNLGGEVESREESFGGLSAAILVAIFGILAVLVLEFGSFKSTLIVATVIPFGIMGGLVALLLTGNSLSFTAFIGFIALVGIEIKNSILLVDFTNQLREQGHALDHAIEKAGEIRFLPILLTSATAIGGLLPLALQNSALYSPMAWVIIGGLVSSTLLARLVTPVMYKLMPPQLHGQPVEVRTEPVTA